MLFARRGRQRRWGSALCPATRLNTGLLAREVVITAGDGQEISEEFHDLVQKLCADYQPVGVVEELLVQTIATCWWRKARVIRAENGEIRKRVDTL